jgi:hypothetical protein
MLIELLGTLMFLVSVVGALGVLIALVYGAFTRRFRLIRILLITTATWLALYSVLLAGASLLTPQQVLEAHQERCFDEMCFSVLQATAQSTVSNGAQAQTAQGLYYVVTVQLRNASQRTAQKPDHPAFFLDDGQGHHYQPSQVAQQALGQQPVWDARLQAGERQSRTLVFDAPVDLVQQSPLPRLGITEGSWPTPLIIGDENGPWHQVTVIQLAFESNAVAGRTAGKIALVSGDYLRFTKSRPRVQSRPVTSKAAFNSRELQLVRPRWSNAV